ncbi:hypothetical protein CLU86_3694 [Acidovorax sp. 62]|nr:hypothetical protein CLU86_3694 [Acidovorax sp. 62]
MRWLTVSRCFGAALLLALLAWPLGMLWVLSHEDYHPEPGTLDYYLGLSSLVRGVPLPADGDAPEYYGSTGDGPKQPVSMVTLQVPPEQASATLARLQAYLQTKGLQPTGPFKYEATDTATLQDWEYANPQRTEVVVLRQVVPAHPTAPTDGASRKVTFSVMHYD